jgi:hypothetical protein
MLRILGRGISYWAPETRCRCTDFLFQEWPVIGASVVCVVYMCDIPVVSPHPTETTQSEPEIVNALRAKFQDADTLITGTGSTAAGAVDGRTEMAQ